MNGEYINYLVTITLFAFLVVSCDCDNNDRCQDPRLITSSYYLKINNPTIILNPEANTGFVYANYSRDFNSAAGYEVRITDYLLHCFELRSVDQLSGRVLLQTVNVDFVFRVHFNCITIAPKNINPEEYKCVYEAELQLVPDNGTNIESVFIDNLPDTLQIKGIKLGHKPFFVKEIDITRGLLYYTDYEDWEEIIHWDDDDMLEGTVIELDDEKLFRKNHSGFYDDGHLVFKTPLNRAYTLHLEKDANLNRDRCLYHAKMI